MGLEIISDFIADHPKARKSAEAWKNIIRQNQFKNPAELKQSIRSASIVRPYTVFNISKNDFRLICKIHYPGSVVRVWDMMTHKKYDEGKWKK